MDFAVSYRSARPLEQIEIDAIIRAVNAANLGRSWVRCEPVFLFPELDGHLAGSSKPHARSDSTDSTDSGVEPAHVLPGGTVRDMFGILCELSKAHGVDWEIRHDYENDPIGMIQGGVADEEIVEEIEALAELGDALKELEDEDQA
jgi:hypothetical protein